MDEFFHRWMGPLHQPRGPLYRPHCCLLHRTPSSQSRRAARTGLGVPLPVPARTARPGSAFWSSPEGPGTGRTGTGGLCSGRGRCGRRWGSSRAVFPGAVLTCSLSPDVEAPAGAVGRGAPDVSPRLCLTSVQAPCAPRPRPRDAALSVVPSSGDSWWPRLGTWHRRAGEGAEGARPGLERGWQG